MLKRWTTFLLCLPLWAAAQSPTPSADSIFASIVHLSETLGPRPMGSAQEREALKWMGSRLAAYGADSVFVMPFDRIDTKESGINTHSGTVIGIFRGETDSTIVIGGHIDSDSREIPGANDNASGPATVLELARLWSQRPRHYTMMFAGFGGEERGLVGSEFFVKHYANLDDVALMFSVDMTGVDDDIVLLMEADSSTAPPWLIRDAYALDASLDINRLRYPTHFIAINNLIGGAGSDHIPFLNRHIPAMNFTQGINRHPIHTPMDRAEYLDHDMLYKCAQLLDEMLLKYQQNGIPSERTDGYILWRVLGVLLFLPLWTPKIILILAVAAGMAAFLCSRQSRLKVERGGRIRFSGLKLGVMALGVMIVVRSGDWVMQAVQGLRYPWLVHVNLYLWFAVLWLLAGVFLALQLTRCWRFSPDSYVYVKRATVVLAIYTLLFGLVSARLAVYPALAMLLFSMAVMLRRPAVKTVLLLLAPLPMLRLMFMEALPFLAHFSTLLGFDLNHGPGMAYMQIGFIVLTLFWTLPFAFAAGYGMVTLPRLKSAAKNLRTWRGGVAVLAALLVYGVVLKALPTRNAVWRSQVHVDARYDLNKGEGSVVIAGNDRLDGVRVHGEHIDRSYDGALFSDTLCTAVHANWFSVSGGEEVVSTQRDTVEAHCNWTLSSQRPWHRVSLALKLDTLAIASVRSSLNSAFNRGQMAMVWQADPPENIDVPLTLKVPRGARLIRTVRAQYAQLPVVLDVTSQDAPVRYRSFVVQRDTLSLGDAQ